jgi:excisionase family DNA binding protein
MSKAELHLIRARMRGGVLNKAKRGELETPLPFGFAYDDEGRVVLDPDQQVQQAIRTVFETFRRVGSALGVAKHFRENGLRFPRLIRRPGCPVEVGWGELEHNRVTRILRNPRYAGAFFYGRTRWQKKVDGGWRKKPLAVGQMAVYRMLEEKIIPAVRVGKRWVVTRKAFEKWEESCGLQGVQDRVQ